MVIPLGQQATDELGPHRPGRALRYGAAWDPGGAQVADARRAVRAFLARATHAEHITVGTRPEQDAQLVVSELITNSLRHAPGPCGLLLELSAGGKRLRITVWDTSRELPEIHERDESRIGGHGLFLVRACSRDLSVTPLPGGKEITAEIDLGI
ncbi:hypothetical protein GCM10010129_03210 [Streptomyces fumigatiscleroticus]|nr:hypothetical protein GCM10010129_03210 [Streptomyces fumigatiscleroticus]